MDTVGHRHDSASEHPAVRNAHPWRIVATLAGAVVAATMTGLQLDAVSELPAKIVLTVSIPILFVAAIAAIRPARPKPVRRTGSRPADGLSAADTDQVEDPSEDQRVRAWRRRRLAELGVPNDVALALAADPSFSHHELKRLLAHGCPLGTALRILQPD